MCIVLVVLLVVTVPLVQFSIVYRPNSGQLIYYNMKGFLCSIDAPLIMSTCGDRQSALKSLITTFGDSLSAV